MEIWEHQISLPIIIDSNYTTTDNTAYITLMLLKDDVKMQKESRSS